jgi:hypothetical protein
MAQEKNGCLIFLGIIFGLAAIGVVVVALAYVGLAMVMGLDFVARSFTWLGIESAIVCWLVLGLVTGAFIGLAMGLKRAQRSPGWPVYGGAAAMGALVFLGSFYANPADSNQNPRASTSATNGTGGNTSSNSPSMYIDKIGARITSLRFFEGGFNTPPSEKKRIFGNRFARTKTRSVYWLLDYSFTPKQNRIDFVVDESCYRPDGSLLGTSQIPWFVAPGYSAGSCSHAWGWPQPGQWPTGTYRLDLSVDGKKIATSQFTIY